MSAAITAAVIAVAGSAAAGAAQASAAKKANRATIDNANATNADNLRMSLAARGGPLIGEDVPPSLRGQKSAILPLYFGSQEVNMARNATNLYNQINKQLGTPQEQYDRAAATSARFDPAFNVNEGLVYDLATGKLIDKSIAESQPVFQARTDQAKAKRNAGLEALRETLNEIDSIQAGRGFSGDTTGNRLLRFNARRQVGTQAAQDMTDAQLANATEERNLRSGGRALQLSSLDLPGKMLSTSLSRDTAPLSAVINNQKLAQEPFAMFNIGPGQYNSYERLPEVAPITSGGEIAGLAVSSLASSGGDYLAKKNAAKTTASGLTP
jgi:hypothetical protein